MIKKTLIERLKPAEGESIQEMTDARTGARYFEIHIRASTIIALATTDVPLDPENQAEYRANRDPVINHPAFNSMKEDALKRRSFSNIVAEYYDSKSDSQPIKIIGGQHRYQAIKHAFNQGIDEYHGVKLYHSLNKEQRLDVQLISNTSIAISPDLFDRMQETMRGPVLRDWCQEVGLLAVNQDFADKKRRGGPISVQEARIFILNYFEGSKIDSIKFPVVETTPVIPRKGIQDTTWENFFKQRAEWHKDSGLKLAAQEFVKLDASQRSFYKNKKAAADFANKAMNQAVIGAWAFIAGALSQNPTRLQKHYELANATKHDPLNASQLAKGRHKTDPENYRGLGYRTDPKERGRFAELFFYQAEKGGGIDSKAIDVAIKSYHAKQAALEVESAKVTT